MIAQHQNPLYIHY